ncbi:MAG TPA: tetratricopeptide repeat protein [Thermoanaerobaculia bacterium]|jgi:tetratricopeptide (TPR) repeat protein
MRNERTIPMLLIAALLLMPETAAAPSHCAAPADAVEPALLERVVGVREGIGRSPQKVTTSSPQAQAFSDQGLALLHSYHWIEAARAYHQALRHDPDCAMAWMGLARAEQGLDRTAQASAAIEKAKSLAPKVSPRERRFIELRAQQMEAQSAPAGEQAGKHEAYKRAIEAALAEYPDDAELWILRGNTEEPGPWGRGQFGGVASIAYYETALVRSPGHFGAHHYLVHSFENVGRHAEAAVHGKIYAEAVPGVAHAQHMYGHVLPRLGRWDEARAQLEKADVIERRYAEAEKIRPGDDWHHIHNLQLLGWVYVRQGRYADAEKTFRRAFDTPVRMARSGFQQASLAEFYLLRGRLDDALKAARALSDRAPVARTAGAAVEGEVLLAMGQKSQAREALARARKSYDAAIAGVTSSDARYVDYFLSPYIRQLEAVIGLRDGGDGRELVAMADDLAANPRFDAWGEGLFRLERVATDADRAGKSVLAAEVRERMRKIDPDYRPQMAVTAGR